MHPLSEILRARVCVISYRDDEVLRDYLNGRAEWLKQRLIDYHKRSMKEWVEVCQTIDQAFELTEKHPCPVCATTWCKLHMSKPKSCEHKNTTCVSSSNFGGIHSVFTCQDCGHSWRIDNNKPKPSLPRETDWGSALLSHCGKSLRNTKKDIELLAKFIAELVEHKNQILTYLKERE